MKHKLKTRHKEYIYKKFENRITFEKNKCILSWTLNNSNTENKIIKYKNSKNVPYLKIIEVVIVPCNIGNKNY